MLSRTRAFVAGAMVASLVVAWPAASQAAAPRPVVKGKRLVDSRTGRTFVPRGVNWPSFEYACFYGYAYSDGHTTLTSTRAIARWHINTVRVPLNQDCWLGDDGRPASDADATLTVAGYRAAVKRFVGDIEAAGLVPIIDLHWSGPNGTPAERQRAMPDNRSDDFWSSVARAFKSDRSIMFDAFNEPYSRYDGDTLTFGLTWRCWKLGGSACGAGAPLQDENQSPFDGTRYTPTGMQTLVSAIRRAGTRRPILLGGLDYANDLRHWLANRPSDPAHQLVAAFHNYNGQRCQTRTCWDREIGAVARSVPVVTGEFGESDCRETHDNAYMSWADAHGVGYLAWAWWVLDTSDCSDFAVISDFSGTPRAPNGTALKAHLAALARRG